MINCVLMYGVPCQLGVPGGGVTAGLTTGKTVTRVIIRDASGKFCWDSTVLYGPPRCRAGSYPAGRSLRMRLATITNPGPQTPNPKQHAVFDAASASASACLLIIYAQVYIIVVLLLTEDVIRLFMHMYVYCMSYMIYYRHNILYILYNITCYILRIYILCNIMLCI